MTDRPVVFRQDEPLAPWRSGSWLRPVLWCLALVALYVVMLKYVVGSAAYRTMLSETLLSQHQWVNKVGFVILVNAALLAPGSTAVLVLAAVPVFGPGGTFLLALGGGISATIIGHQLGSWIRSRESRGKRWERVRAAQGLLRRYERYLWILSFASRAIPNPGYDVWPIAFGFFRVPLMSYLLPAVIGGSLALSALCYLPWLLSA